MFRHVETPWFKPSNLKAITHPNGVRFYYDPNDPNDSPRIYLPSITTVLSDYNKSVLDRWRRKVGEEEANRIASAARDRGDAFHAMAERYIKNEDPVNFLEEFSPLHRRTFNQARRIITKHVNKVQIQEQPLMSKTLGVAGRVDLIAEWDGVLSVIDFKGSNRMKKEDWITTYFMQASAYAYCYWEMTGKLIKQIVVLISGDDFSVKSYIKNSAIYLPDFKKEKDKWLKAYAKKILTTDS